MREVRDCPDPDWDDLRSRHRVELVNELRVRFFEPGGPIELTVEQLLADLDATADLEAAAKNLLLKVLGPGEWYYFCSACESELSEPESQGEKCPHCRVAFADRAVKREERFACYRPPKRHVKWMLTLHGMNTPGPWQEAFNWLVSKSYRYSVPVAIYKYGVVRPSAFIKFRQDSFKRRVTEQARRLTGEAEGEGFGGKPDVIAHSLGTWLLGHALLDDPTLKVGRVILLGSILRPDFPWNELLAREQVEAVLNNYGTKDFWALIAHYFIPDSGPSGRIGFDRYSGVRNVPARGYGHSSFFRPAENLQNGFASLWTMFLSEAAERLDMLPGQVVNETNWQQSFVLFRATLSRYLLLFIALVVLLFVTGAFVVGLLVFAVWILKWL